MSDPEDKPPQGEELSIDPPAASPQPRRIDDTDVPHIAPELVEKDELPDFNMNRALDADDDSDAHNHASSLAVREQQLDDGSDMSSFDAAAIDAIPRSVGSPSASIHSGPDDSPSAQGSLVSSPAGSVRPSRASRPGFRSPSPSFQPFDRRFQSRITSPSTLSPRPSSPAFLAPHSRNASLGSNFVLDTSINDTPTPPWEVVRWTRLKKLNGQAFSEAGKRNFGSPTCLAVSASIVLGTSKGVILMFDYNQNLKMIIGPGTKAAEAGPITSIAVSADHTTVAAGHASGNIFTWDTTRASRPFLTIPPLEGTQVENRTADGHISNVAVIHLGFLGTRHTALVSADDRGMAFSHLATRGTGALGRSVRTTRILGRYPNAPTPVGKTIKPSTVLAFASLPLGNVERATDTLGLTAMLTPYLLVIVSTTPIAQTQHKAARPKDVPAHSAMTGCLAWFPAVKLKVPDPASGSDTSRVKLAYCWSNILTVLEIDQIEAEDKDRPPVLKFKARSRWKCEESIVAVQWISRSVLTVLTISQRLIVLEDRSMRMTEAFDLLQRYIYHTDLFSNRLHTLVEQLDEDDQTMHGVVADAFYMSFKAYKGRIFVLGFNEVSIGALSNWADRLIAMMDNGDYIGAIQLATSYYTGDANKLTVGLPEDATLRHNMVQDKIMEIIGASLKYVFVQRQNGNESADDEHLKQLAETCFISCQSVDNVDFLFDEMYNWYEDADVSSIFLEALEPYVLEETITIVPPAVIKDMISYYVTQGWETRLEEMICHMQTATMDLDQTTLLCKQHGLYEALIYVWNQAIGDYITPMIDLLSLLFPMMNNGGYSPEDGSEYYSLNSRKIFPYLSYILTGRVYPSGEMMDDETATKAKAEIYWFFFSGKTIEWPKDSGREFRTRPAEESQPAFPYLRMILQFDAPSFLSALNEAFEDAFLNDSPEKQVNGSQRMDMPEEQIFGLTINRQYVVSILLDVMNVESFTPEDTIYLDMFIARNLPKFPQYLLFSGSTLASVLIGLCNYHDQDAAEDAQLSAEYLLSVYHPSEMSEMIPLFRKAGFYRILKRIYKVDKQYGKLLQTYFEDPEEQDEVFGCISDSLNPHKGLDDRQLRQVRQVIEEHPRDLLEIDAERTAITLRSQGGICHDHMLASAADAPELQHTYLKALLESEDPQAGNIPEGHLIEQYVQLMCRFDPSHVSEYIERVQSVSLRLDRLLPVMEETGVIDAAVVLMVQDGQIEGAMERLTHHLQTLDSSVLGLLDGQGQDDGYFDLESAIEELLQSMQRYVYVGIWLCKGQTKAAKRVKVQRKHKEGEEKLPAAEALWLSLVDACVQIAGELSPKIISKAKKVEMDGDRLLALLRSLVQHTFTALLTATSSQYNNDANSKVPSSAGANLSFIRVLRAFLARAAAKSPNLADLRNVLASIFAAYAYEESILRLSNRLLERSLFVSVSQSADLRQRGWRPRGSTCEACSRRVWGPGVSGGAVFEAWEDKEAREEMARREKSNNTNSANGGAGESVDKGKGKSLDLTPAPVPVPEAIREEGSGKDALLGPLVVLACRHIYHQTCLDALQEKDDNGLRTRIERDYICPIDG